MTKSKKIIAVGGGEIGRPGFPVETLEIDREIVRLSRKKHPRLLFLPTASNDSDGYIKCVEEHFGGRLGCKVTALKLINTKLTEEEIKEKIFGADIVYVGGGNTAKMLYYWKRHRVDQMLKRAWEKGIVLSGLSAGSICWFQYGSSDSRKFRNPDANLVKLKGLNFIPALHVPHYDVEKNRKPELKAMMKNTTPVAIAIDNCAAIEIINEKYRIISSKQTANAYKTYWKKGQYIEEKIEKTENFRSLKKLLKKKLVVL